MFNCFSKAKWELQTAVLKLHGSRDGFSNPHEQYRHISSTFNKAMFSSHATIEQLLQSTQEDLGNL